MSVNVGTLDRIIRAVIGLVALWLAFFSGAAFAVGLVKVILLIVGLIMLATAAMRICPLYWIFGIRTCRAD